MSSYYNIPEEYSEPSYIFNPESWTSPADVTTTTITASGTSSGTASGTASGNYVSKTGDIMSGGLVAPSITTPVIYFLDYTEQTSAADVNKVNTSAIKTTALSYDASLNVTDIGNYTCSNYDVASLEGMTGNLQTRINNLETKTSNQTLASSTQTNFSQNVYIPTLTAGNFNSSYLSGTASNIQAQLNSTSGVTRLIKWEDDFIDGLRNNKMTWYGTAGNGPIVQTNDEENHIGIIRLFATNDRILYPELSMNAFYWNSIVKMEFIFKTEVMSSNKNVNFHIGLSENNTASASSILWAYDTDANGWRMKVNNIVVQTAPLMILTNGDWWYGSFADVSGKYVHFYLKNLTNGSVCNYQWLRALPQYAVTTLSTTAPYRPYFRVTNTDGTGTKVLAIDYVSIQYSRAFP